MGGSRASLYSNLSVRPSNISVKNKAKAIFDDNMDEIQGQILGQRVNRILTDENPSCRRLLEHMVASGKFESFFAALILLNAIAIAAQVEYQGNVQANQFNFGSSGRSTGAYPWAAHFFRLLEIIFGSFFTVELLLKLIGLGVRRTFKDIWNWVDTILVVFWLVDVSTAQLELPANPMLLRLVRLVRLLRLLKLIRRMQAMDALLIILTSIRCSFGILVWAIIVLTLAEMMLGLIANQMLVSFVEDSGEPYEKRLEVFLYFGTFSRCLFTMFELTFGGWAKIGRLLIGVNGWWGVPILLHQFMIGFAVLSVVRGVFIQQTFKVAETDNYIMMKQREREARIHAAKMKRLFKTADKDGSGGMDLAEFKDICNNSFMKEWMFAYGLLIDDVDKLWTLIDRDADDLVTCEELMKAVKEIRGPARSVDMKHFLLDFEKFKQEMITLAHSRREDHSGIITVAC